MRKRIYPRYVLFVGLLAHLAWTDAPAQTTVGRLVQGNAGGSAESNSFKLIATIGQASPPAQANSQTIFLLSGYIYTLDLNAPRIHHTAIDTQNANQAILIKARITDDTRVASATLKFRQGGDTSFDSLAMAKVDSAYQAEIPGSVVISQGVEYFITAMDLDRKTVRWPPPNTISSIRVRVSGLTKPTAQPSGTAETAYRLISVPLQLDNQSPMAVLGDELGSYDIFKWRLYSWSSKQQKYFEVTEPEAGNFEPGKSFFLIVKDPDKKIDAGSGLSVKTDKPFEIRLEPGHNFVASPFNFEIPIQNLLKNGRQVSDKDVREYDREWKPGVSYLSPWSGYNFPNNTDAPVTLLINPNLTPGGISGQKAAQINNEGWQIQILATCKEARDTHNFAGVAPGSDDGCDERDLVESPPIGEYISLYFSHPEWRKPLSRYMSDIRSPEKPLQGWDFVVESNIIGETITLQFDRLQEIPGDLEVFLADFALDYKRNLRKNTSYQFQVSARQGPKKLALLVGSAAQIAEHLAGLTDVPEHFMLYKNFPNPFNPETTIRFDLPASSRVTLKIFDINGREVATLLANEELEAGRYQRIWDGHDDQGRAVASGVYFYRLMAQDFSKTLKMTLMK